MPCLKRGRRQLTGLPPKKVIWPMSPLVGLPTRRTLGRAVALLAVRSAAIPSRAIARASTRPRSSFGTLLLLALGLIARASASPRVRSNAPGLFLGKREQQSSCLGRLLDVGRVAGAGDQLGLCLRHGPSVFGEPRGWVVDDLLFGAHDHQQWLA